MNKPCEACIREKKLYNPNKVINIATQKHHMLHNKKPWNVIYKDLINDPRNFMDVCASCNVGHNGIGLIHLDEYEFCEIMEVEPRSKQAQLRRLRDGTAGTNTPKSNSD